MQFQAKIPIRNLEIDSLSNLSKKLVRKTPIGHPHSRAIMAFLLSKLLSSILQALEENRKAS